MAISATSGGVIAAYTQGAQFQQTQARRNAEQAERAALALQNEASQARNEADRAQENARALEVRSDQAQTDARGARQGVAAINSLGEVSKGLDNLQQQARNVSTNTTSSTTTSAPAVINTQGQTTGTVINVTA
jgi:hypothetical protein